MQDNSDIVERRDEYQEAMSVIEVLHKQLDSAPPSTMQDNWPADARFQYGDEVHVVVKRDGQPRFFGIVVGWYRPTDGRHFGYVVEHDIDGIIHVNPDRALMLGGRGRDGEAV